MNYFVTAIGTDSGKTLISAIITTALHADYWKPIQAGFPTDSDTIRNLCPKTTVHQEGIILKTPASPHSAAAIENIRLTIDQLKVPVSNQPLVIEGAGGIMVPLNDKETMIDMILPFNAEIILVSNLYLGSINHTLLTLEAIQKRNLPLKGIIFNGVSNPSSEEIIQNKAGVPVLLHVEQENNIDQKIITDYARKFKNRWDELGFQG